MTVEIDIKKFGDYGLLFAALLDALLRLDHAAVGSCSEKIAQLARQKVLDRDSNPAGVRLAH